MPHPPIDKDSWKTPKMARVEAELDEAARKVDEHLEKAAELDFSDPPLSDEDVQRFEQAARDPNAPPEMQRLAQRVDRGEFSWRDVTEGHAIRDPKVREAFAAAGEHVDASPLRMIAEQLREGKTAEEIVAAAQQQQAQVEPGETSPAGKPAPPKPPEHVDDDEYFNRNTYMTNDW